MAANLELFREESTYQAGQIRPLADRLRPISWDDFAGIGRIDQRLLKHLQAGQGIPPSLILWGPPGCGKTTLAKLIGQTFNCEFIEFSAVLGGVKDVREIVERARHTKRPTILFVDEIHRFNKAQQDAFLPHVERGTIVLIGATTENPSFALTGALLSRAKVVFLKGLELTELKRVLERACLEKNCQLDLQAQNIFCEVAGGDARRLLNVFESFYQSLLPEPGAVISKDQVEDFLKDSRTLFYDRSGEEHYNMSSAFIKSLRGSDPDAALFWGFRMLESGEDPRFIIRRLVIFASEDIGNADPRALQLAVSTSAAFELVGLPEGRIPIAQCITYLASAPKSNRSYAAMNKVVEALRTRPKVTVPLHIRNAPTDLMKSMNYGKDYAYPHDTEHGYVPDVQYLPDELKNESFYEPAQQGYEKTIAERLTFWRKLGKS